MVRPEALTRDDSTWESETEVDRRSDVLLAHMRRAYGIVSISGPLFTPSISGPLSTPSTAYSHIYIYYNAHSFPRRSLAPHA